jgi:hypothetical protein
VAGLAGYVQWLSGQIDDVRQQIPEQLAAFRAQAQQNVAHARTPDAVAHLALGWRVFLRFALEVEALTYDEAEALWERVWQALGESAAVQAQHQVSEEPARRFIDLLESALSGGFAHVASPTGNVPDHPEAWGWRKRTVGTGEYERIEWQPQGDRAGWIDGHHLYLDLEAALTAVRPVAQATGSPVGVTPRTLAKRLHERGFLLSTDEKNRELKVRRTLEERRHRVLHLAASTITREESSHSGQSDPADANSAAGRAFSRSHGRMLWPDADDPERESGQETRPNTVDSLGSGRDGGIGRVLGDGGDSRLDASVQISTTDVDPTAEVGEWAATL